MNYVRLWVRPGRGRI